MSRQQRRSKEVSVILAGFIEQTAKDYSLSIEQVQEVYNEQEEPTLFYKALEELVKEGKR